MIHEVCIKKENLKQTIRQMLDVGCLIRLQRPLPFGLYPLSCELQMAVIARLRNFNMVNILCISSSFNIITNFTIFYRRTELVIIGNYWKFFRVHKRSSYLYFIPFSAQTTRKESSRRSKPAARTYLGI